MFGKIGMIGCGNMGSVIAKIVFENAGGCTFYLADHSRNKAEKLSAELPGSTVSCNTEIAGNCDLLILGVKPQVMPSVLAEIAPVLKERKDGFTLVTMAAGLNCETIRQMAGVDCPVIRIMPNLPAGIGCGVIMYCGLGTAERELDGFASLLGGSGTVDRIDEKLIDAASAISGCGPAFAYMFIEALADGGVECGLPRDKALAYAARTLEGAAAMVRESGCHPAVLKDAVCSPGGTTIEGVRVLEEHGFRAAAMNAVTAAYEKTVRLK